MLLKKRELVDAIGMDAWFVICLLTLHEDASRTLKTGKREREREKTVVGKMLSRLREKKRSPEARSKYGDRYNFGEKRVTGISLYCCCCCIVDYRVDGCAKCEIRERVG